MGRNMETDRVVPSARKSILVLLGTQGEEIDWKGDARERVEYFWFSVDIQVGKAGVPRQT